MWLWWRGTRTTEAPVAVADRVRAKYTSFRELLALNNESLELMARLQEDLQYVPPRRDVLGDRIPTIFAKIGEVVAALQRLTGVRYDLSGGGTRCPAARDRTLLRGSRGVGQTPPFGMAVGGERPIRERRRQQGRHARRDPQQARAARARRIRSHHRSVPPVLRHPALERDPRCHPQPGSERSGGSAPGFRRTHPQGHGLPAAASGRSRHHRTRRDAAEEWRHSGGTFQRQRRGRRKVLRRPVRQPFERSSRTKPSTPFEESSPDASTNGRCSTGCPPDCARSTTPWPSCLFR